MTLEVILKDNEGFILNVSSETDETQTYTVAVDYSDGWWCNCPDYHFRKHECKHMRTVKQYIQKHYPMEYEKVTRMEVFTGIQKNII